MFFSYFSRIFIFLSLFIGLFYYFFFPKIEGFFSLKKEWVLILTLIQIIPYFFTIAVYFVFLKNRYIKTKTFINNIKPFIVIFLIALGSALCLQFYFSEKIILSELSEKLQQQEKEFIKNIAQKKNLDKGIALYHQDTVDSLRKALVIFQLAHKNFPSEIRIEKYLIKTKLALEKRHSSLSTQISFLEKKVVEARNKKNYLQAIEYYQKLLNLYPIKKEYFLIRKQYQDSLDFCSKQRQDPQKNLTEAQINQQSLNNLLVKLKEKLNKKEMLREAYLEAKKIFIHYENNHEIKSIYYRLYEEVQTRDFFLSEFFNFLQYSTPTLVYTNSFLQLGKDSFLKAKKIYLLKNKIYFKGFFYKSPSQDYSASYAKLYRDHLFLKNQDNKIAEKIKSPLLLAETYKHVFLFSSDTRKNLFVFLDPLSLYQVKKTATEHLRYHSYFFNMLFLHQLIFPFFCFFLFFLMSYYSARHSALLKYSHQGFFFSLFFSSFWAFVYLFLIYFFSFISFLYQPIIGLVVVFILIFIGFFFVFMKIFQLDMIRKL